ncbi:hypothetical protein PR003_g29522 [Phytophthora rubi]|uniref:Secreted protein n=1 Tax=Phytophthora rubi TaxID=129364 RepID=A0A6A3H9D0_9STRA|nr:hypothetical protein PR002_g28588 [Phytophthora rubi]KAE9274732.1 hypothetical protein PR003_g29522 [Phytophthora rubi]
MLCVWCWRHGAAMSRCFGRWLPAQLQPLKVPGLAQQPLSFFFLPNRQHYGYYPDEDKLSRLDGGSSWVSPSTPPLTQLSHRRSPQMSPLGSKFCNNQCQPPWKRRRRLVIESMQRRPLRRASSTRIQHSICWVG